MFGMNRLNPFQEISSRPNRPWMELILPLFSLGMILLYYRPQVLVPIMEDILTHRILWWGLWVIIGAFGGLMALSALFLAFALLYSVVYLVANARRILDPQAWVDQREVRFYLGFFVILCGLLTLAFLRPEAALVSFTLLAGFAQVLCRLLV